MSTAVEILETGRAIEVQAAEASPASEETLRRRFEAEALPHLRSLYGTAYRMTRNAHDAEDLVQETVLRAFRAFDGYTEGTNIKAWLYTILHRVRTDAYRKQARSPRTVEMPEQGPARPPEQEALFHGGEDIERALQALPESFRTAVVLRDAQDMSYDEIAQILSVPVGTVMSRIHRGRALLRQALQSLKPLDRRRARRLEEVM
jgi:RNA polymerase sigma-70 factor (ECF subfamily)